MWEATDKTGAKFEAFETWKRVGQPSAEVVGPSWRKWVNAWGGYVWHVRRYLRGRLFEQEPPTAAASIPRAETKADRIVDGVRNWTPRKAVS